MSDDSAARPIVRRAGVILLVAVALACTSAPLVNPAPIPAGKTAAATRAAILRGIVRSHWKFVSEKPGEVVAQIVRNRWAMTVGIDYGAQVSIHYMSSRGLDYENSSGQSSIRRGYNRRVRHLMATISDEMTLGRVHPN